MIIELCMVMVSYIVTSKDTYVSVGIQKKDTPVSVGIQVWGSMPNQRINQSSKINRKEKVIRKCNHESKGLQVQFKMKS